MSTVKLYVKHNAEIAHRLSMLPGKCQQIHGHSLQVELWLMGPTDDNGIMGGLDFGVIKKKFRSWIDQHYDHRLLLNVNDPLLRQCFDFWTHGNESFTISLDEKIDIFQKFYPGLLMTSGDPNVENLTKTIFGWASEIYSPLHVRVNVQETNSNGAECGF
jgi:6-pyruvoyl-tetrahydropterin synthase